MRASAFSKGGAQALNGVQDDASRYALGVVSELNSVVDLLYVIAVLQLDHVPAKCCELSTDALAVAHNLVNSTVELVLVVVYEANEVVQLVVSCELSSSQTWPSFALAVANEYEYVAVAAVELVARAAPVAVDMP
mgnify:CR=1 FL=1